MKSFGRSPLRSTSVRRSIGPDCVNQSECTWKTDGESRRQGAERGEGGHILPRRTLDTSRPSYLFSFVDCSLSSSIFLWNFPTLLNGLGREFSFIMIVRPPLYWWDTKIYVRCFCFMDGILILINYIHPFFLIFLCDERFTSTSNPNLLPRYQIEN